MKKKSRKKGMVCPIILGVIGLIFIVSGCVSKSLVAFKSQENGLASLRGHLFRPPGDGPFPAIVLLHETFGVQSKDLQFGNWLSNEGYVAIVVDSNGSRGKIPTYKTMMLDAFDAAEYLRSISFVKGELIAVMGFSQGAAAALEAASISRSSRIPTKGFKSVVAYYPPCQSLHRDTDIPVLLLLGEKDARTPPDQCIRVAQELKESGKNVSWVVYSNSMHGFVNSDWHGHYNARATADSKKQIRGFLEQHLR